MEIKFTKWQDWWIELNLKECSLYAVPVLKSYIIECLKWTKFTFDDIAKWSEIPGWIIDAILKKLNEKVNDIDFVFEDQDNTTLRRQSIDIEWTLPHALFSSGKWFDNQTEFAKILLKKMDLKSLESVKSKISQFLTNKKIIPHARRIPIIEILVDHCWYNKDEAKKIVDSWKK